MTSRMRKLTGAIALLALIVVYAFLAVAVAAVLQMQNVNKVAELLFYMVAGLLWTLPAGIIIRWMQRSDA
jgi:hypothetical protein